MWLPPVSTLEDIFLETKLVNSTLRTVFWTTDLFSYACRPTVADFFREFYKWKFIYT